MSVAFYISGHGFGHASRQIEVMNAFGVRQPKTRILVRTSAPQWLFNRTVGVPFHHFSVECDTGVVQVDSLHLDIDETVRRAREFYATFARRVEHEAMLLKEQEVRLVVSDAPPLACAAAARAGIPAIVVSNFTWDWIYEGYASEFAAHAPDVLPLMRDAYGGAREALRLPLHGGFETFERITDLPLVARHSRRDIDRTEVLTALSLPADRSLALSSFGGYGVDDLDFERLDCLKEWTVVITGREPPAHMPDGIVFVDESLIYSHSLRYEDLVAACDVVVTKPGYGIIAECIANDTAMLYTSRGHFVEYDVLVREMPRYLRCAYLEQQGLLDGRWLKALDELLVTPAPPEKIPTDGADVAAGLISAALD